MLSDVVQAAHLHLKAISWKALILRWEIHTGPRKNEKQALTQIRLRWEQRFFRESYPVIRT